MPFIPKPLVPLSQRPTSYLTYKEFVKQDSTRLPFWQGRARNPEEVEAIIELGCEDEIEYKVQYDRKIRKARDPNPSVNGPSTESLYALYRNTRSPGYVGDTDLHFQ